MPNNKKRKRNKHRSDPDTTNKPTERTYIVAYATQDDTMPILQTNDISPSSSNTISSSLSTRTVTLVSTPIPSSSIEMPFNYSLTQQRSPTRQSPTRHSLDRQISTKYSVIQHESPTRQSPTKNSQTRIIYPSRKSPTSHRSPARSSPVKFRSPSRQTSVKNSPATKVSSKESPTMYILTRKRSCYRESLSNYNLIRNRSLTGQGSSRNIMNGKSPPKCTSIRKGSLEKSYTKYDPSRQRSYINLNQINHDFAKNGSRAIENPSKSNLISPTKKSTSKFSPIRHKSPFRKSPNKHSPIKQRSPSIDSPTKYSPTRVGSAGNTNVIRDRPTTHGSPTSESPTKCSPTNRSPTKENLSKCNLTRQRNNTMDGSPDHIPTIKGQTMYSPTRNVIPTIENLTTYSPTKRKSSNSKTPSKYSSNRQKSPIGQSLIKQKNPSNDNLINRSLISQNTTQNSPTRKSPSRLSPIPTCSSRLSPHNIDFLQHGDVPKSYTSTTPLVHEENNTIIIPNIQPLVIFDSTKRMYVKESTKKSSKSKKHSLKVKNVIFKNKKKSLNSKLEKYYLKVKQSPDISSKIQKDLYSDQVLSRSKDLKKVLAKEDLLADSIKDKSTSKRCYVTYTGGYNSNENAPNASLSTLETSHSSTNVSRMIENSSGADDLSTSNSVINTLQAVNSFPYKTEIINVGVAVTYNKPAVNNNFENYNERRENFLFTENLTSTETITGVNVPLTEESHFNRRNSPSHFVTSVSLTNENMSENTLIGDQMSDVWANNVDKRQSTTESTYTVTFNNSEMIVHTANLEHDKILTTTDKIPESANAIKKMNNFTTTKLEIIDTFKSKGMLSSIIPSCSSAQIKDKFNSIVIAGDQCKIDNFTNNKRDAGNERMIQSNILKKYYENNDLTGFNKINLPNEATIKLMIDEQQNKKTCAEESKSLNTSATFADMWEKMFVVLDLTVKRLEDTLADKILKEIKKTFTAHEISTNQKSMDETMGMQNSVYLNKEVFVDKNLINIDSEKSLQCNLVQNQVIDKVMLEMSMEPQLPPSLSLPAKIELYTRNRDELHILKPPTVPSLEEVIEVAAASESTTNTAEAMPLALGKKSKILQSMKDIVQDPMKFLSENAIVIATVPAFFLMFFMIYIFIALAIQ